MGKSAGLPLFPDEHGRPFRDATFASHIMAALEAAVGKERAKLLSPHSWRVWLASALRMCDATDARIQAMGRWLNPESHEAVDPRCVLFFRHPRVQLHTG